MAGRMAPAVPRARACGITAYSAATGFRGDGPKLELFQFQAFFLLREGSAGFLAPGQNSTTPLIEVTPWPGSALTCFPASSGQRQVPVAPRLAAEVDRRLSAIADYLGEKGPGPPQKRGGRGCVALPQAYPARTCPVLLARRLGPITAMGRRGSPGPCFQAASPTTAPLLRSAFAARANAGATALPWFGALPGELPSTGLGDVIGP